MRNFFGWLVIFGGCLLGACSHSRSPDVLVQISGVWTEGTPNSMVYLNLAGHQKTFAMAATPGIIYPADVAAIDSQNHIVTVNVSFPGKGGEGYVVRPYVFRQVPVGQEGQFRLVMTAPTGRQAMMSFVRQLSAAERGAQPTEFASAAGETELEPAAPAPAQPATGQQSTAPAQSATRPAPAPAAPPTAKSTPAPAAPPAAIIAQAPTAPSAAKPAPKPAGPSAAKPPAAKPPAAKPAPKPAKPLPAPAKPPAVKPRAPAKPPAVKPPAPAKPPAVKHAPAPAKPVPAPAAGPSTCGEGTPAARHGCATRAFHAVDRALNKRYREVMADLPASRRAALERQEIQWIRLKRRQCEAQARRTPGGDLLRRTAQLQCWTQLTQKRLAELEHDY